MHPWSPQIVRRHILVFLPRHGRNSAAGYRGHVPALLCALGLCLLLCAACGGGKNGSGSGNSVPKPTPAAKPSEVHWTYQPGTLELKIQAHNDLNTYNDHAHATRLCIYQLRKPSGFKQLATSKGGIRKLLQCQNFDSSVVDFEKHSIQPGHNSTLHLARAENAKHVGLVTGYYDLAPGNVTRLYTIPLHKTHSGLLWWSKTKYAPGKLTMRVLLGAHSMQRIGEQ